MQSTQQTESAKQMPAINENQVALDFFQTLKSGILMYSMALTETTNPQVRKILMDQLKEVLSLQKETSDMLISKGWLPIIARTELKPPKLHFS